MLSFPLTSFAVTPPSRLTTVTVYPDRALATRVATVELTAGSHVVTFANLPSGVIDDSVRVEGKGSATARIVGVEVKRAFLDQEGSERVRKLQEEIDTVEGSQSAVQGKLATLTSQRAFLDAIRASYSERLAKELLVSKPSTTELAELLRFLGDGLNSINSQERQLVSEKKKLNERLDALRREMQQVQGESRRESPQVSVSLEVAKGGSLNLSLSYVVPGASWQPVYDLRLGEDGKNVELTYRAEVRQTSGEEWQDLDMTLSTARPDVGGNLPELHSWLIGFVEVMPMAAPAPATMGLMKSERSRMYELEDRAAAVEENEAPPLTSSVEEERSLVLFHLPRRATVPSDGFPHTVTVAVEQLPVALAYATTPKLSPHAFLKGSVTNSATYPLLSGKANIFVGSAFAGSLNLSQVAARENFPLFFGSDDGIRVKREELVRQKEGGFASRSRMTFRYRMELQNFKKEAVTVTLSDQLPVARNEEIRVTMLEASPNPSTVKEDTGEVSWQLTLAPQEKREVIFEFRVEYPKDRELAGI
jgi:uncharacterized protein (TIGR02231 family)